MCRGRFDNRSYIIGEESPDTIEQDIRKIADPRNGKIVPQKIYRQVLIYFQWVL